MPIVQIIVISWVFTSCILICSNMSGECVTLIFRVTEFVWPDPSEPFMNFIRDQQMQFGFMM